MKTQEKPCEGGGRDAQEVKKCWEPPEAGAAWKDSPTETSEGDLQ